MNFAPFVYLLANSNIITYKNSADATINTNSNNYKTGYTAGMTDANKMFSSNGSSSGNITINTKVTTPYPPYVIYISQSANYPSSYEFTNIIYVRDAGALGYRNYHDSYNNTDAFSHLNLSDDNITWYNDGFMCSKFSGYSYTVYY